MRSFPCSLLLLATLCACGARDADTVCTLEARSSVNVMVVDSHGRPQRDAQVTFTLDGGAEQEALCDGGASTQGSCSSWVTNYERAGTYVITATSADGTRTAHQEVTVTEGTCHVNSTSVTLTLPD